MDACGNNGPRNNHVHFSNYRKFTNPPTWPLPIQQQPSAIRFHTARHAVSNKLVIRSKLHIRAPFTHENESSFVRAKSIAYVASFDVTIREWPNHPLREQPNVTEFPTVIHNRRIQKYIFYTSDHILDACGWMGKQSHPQSGISSKRQPIQSFLPLSTDVNGGYFSAFYNQEYLLLAFTKANEINCNCIQPQINMHNSHHAKPLIFVAFFINSYISRTVTQKPNFSK